MKKSKSLEISILLSSLIIVAALFYTSGTTAKKTEQNNSADKKINAKQNRQNGLFPKSHPRRWSRFAGKMERYGPKMTSVGVIDKAKFEEMYASPPRLGEAGRGGLNNEERNLLEGLENGYLKSTPENSGFVLNLLWALGLGNKNEILETAR